MNPSSTREVHSVALSKTPLHSGAINFLTPFSPQSLAEFLRLGGLNIEKNCDDKVKNFERGTWQRQAEGNKMASV